jgi:hypothetical protein
MVDEMISDESMNLSKTEQLTILGALNTFSNECNDTEKRIKTNKGSFLGEDTSWMLLDQAFRKNEAVGCR